MPPHLSLPRRRPQEVRVPRLAAAHEQAHCFEDDAAELQRGGGGRLAAGECSRSPYRVVAEEDDAATRERSEYVRRSAQRVEAVALCHPLEGRLVSRPDAVSAAKRKDCAMITHTIAPSRPHVSLQGRLPAGTSDPTLP